MELHWDGGREEQAACVGSGKVCICAILPKSAVYSAVELKGGGEP